jgi:hypothetical protein
MSTRASATTLLGKREGIGPNVGSIWSRALVLPLAWSTFAACGGTTGRDGIAGNPALFEAGADAALDAVSSDATVEDASALDAGAEYDVTIQYADAARLPHFDGSGMALPDAGDGATEAQAPGANWPACACDSVDPISQADIPSDSGTCPTFVWTRNRSCDNCARMDGCGPSQYTFPPCCDLGRDPTVASNLSQNPPRPGVLRFELCADLYDCVTRNFHPDTNTLPAQDFSVQIHTVYCGNVTQQDCLSKGPNGPCKDKVEAAFESQDVSKILANLTVNSSTAKSAGLAPEGPEVFATVYCIQSQGFTSLTDPANCYPACFGQADAQPGSSSGADSSSGDQ